MSGDSPWRETVRLGELARGPARRGIEADAAARTRVARLLGLVSIESLAADLDLRPWLDGAEIHGRFRADVTQTCGVTAEPFAAKAEGEFTVRVLPAGSPNISDETAEEVDLDPDADDPPDILEGEDIDLAGYVVEHLSLELDPFPRKPGAEFVAPKDEADLSPFAVLRLLRKDEPPE